MSGPSEQAPADQAGSGRSVTVVGGGIAGMTAALRLLERGFDVTLIEQNKFVGGKLGAHRHGKHDNEPTPAGMKPDEAEIWHEHCYHMYLNWYHNFWAIMQEAGLIDRFEAFPTLNYIHADRPGRVHTLHNIGAPASTLGNMFAGVLSPADMFLYGYSLLDLCAEPMRRGSQLERLSVLAYMSERKYNTQSAVEQHSRTLAEAFACPSYLSSSRSYRSLIQYGLRQPSPMMWLLRGNTAEHLFEPLRKHLLEVARAHHVKFDLRLGLRVDQLTLEAGRVIRLSAAEQSHSPSIDCPGPKPQDGPTIKIGVPGDIILAVPPNALASLVSREVFTSAPSLGEVRRLRTEPMASLDILFSKRLPDLPRGITLLLDSLCDLSFLDLTQLWPEIAASGRSYINVIASDFDVLAGYADKNRTFIIERLLEELRRFVAFDNTTDVAATHLQSNVGEELFVNQVGSWDSRPEAVCGIPNLFIAGDFCRTFVDVVTIEAAVVSGLNAAEAVRRRAGVGSPIPIGRPSTYPVLPLAVMRDLAAPYAYAAKALSLAGEMLRDRYRAIFPTD